QSVGVAGHPAHGGQAQCAPWRRRAPALHRGRRPPLPRREQETHADVDADRALRRPHQQRRPQIRPLPLRRRRQGVGHRPRPDLPCRPQAADRDLGLRGPACAAGCLRRRRARAPRARARGGRQDDGRPHQPGRAARPQTALSGRPRPWMEVPRSELGLVDPMAAGVTKPTLLSFRGLMRLSGSPRLYPVVVVFGAVALAAALTVVSPLTRNPVIAQCQPSSGVSCPTPTPVNAFLSLDVTAGGSNTVINVSGGQFLPNEAVTLYWDQPNKVAGSATADGSGSFNTRVKPFAGDALGVHRLCASVPPQPCANFALQASTASPSPSSSPTGSPSPSASPDQTPTTFAVSPARITTNLSGCAVTSRPPSVA